MSLPNLHHNEEMSMRLHTKDMTCLSDWMLESESTKLAATDNQKERKDNSVAVYQHSFHLLRLTKDEISRQIGAHCTRLRGTDQKHWSSMSVLFQRVLQENKKMRSTIHDLNQMVRENKSSHATEMKRQNKMRERLGIRVTEAEHHADSLKAQLKTQRYLRKAAEKERDALEEMLESHLGGGSAGGRSNASSNEYLDALEQSTREINLLHTLDEVVESMNTERSRREGLCNEMSGLVTRLGLAIGLDDSKFAVSDDEEEEVGGGEEDNVSQKISDQASDDIVATTDTHTTTSATSLALVAGGKKLSKKSKKSKTNNATRFLRATQKSTLGAPKRSVAVQAFTSSLRFEHTLSRRYGGETARRVGVWLSRAMKSKVEVLRLVACFAHLAPPLLLGKGNNEHLLGVSTGSAESGGGSGGGVSGGTTSLLSSSSFSSSSFSFSSSSSKSTSGNLPRLDTLFDMKTGARIIQGIGKDYDIMVAEEDDPMGEVEEEENESLIKVADALRPKIINVDCLPILLRSRISDRNVMGRPWITMTPHDMLLEIINIYFDRAEELKEKRRTSQGGSGSVLLASMTNRPAPNSGAASTSIFSSSTSSDSNSDSDYILAPAPMLQYVLSRINKRMNGVASLAEYHATQFFLNVQHCYKTVALRLQQDNETRLMRGGLGFDGGGSGSGSGGEEKSSGSKKSNRGESIAKRNERKAAEENKKKQEVKDVRRLGLFCRMTGIIGNLTSALSSNATRFIMSGLLEACAVDATITRETLQSELEHSMHGQSSSSSSLSGAEESSGTKGAAGKRSSSRSKSGSRGGSHHSAVFVDRSVVHKIVAKLCSSALRKKSADLDMTQLLMPFDFTEIQL